MRTVRVQESSSATLSFGTQIPITQTIASVIDGTDQSLLEHSRYVPLVTELEVWLRGTGRKNRVRASVRIAHSARHPTSPENRPVLDSTSGQFEMELDVGRWVVIAGVVPGSGEVPWGDAAVAPRVRSADSAARRRTTLWIRVDPILAGDE